MKNEFWFQWLTPEDFCKVSKLLCIEEDEGIEYLCFDDGSRCNKDYVVDIKDAMKEIPETAIMVQLDNRYNTRNVTFKTVGGTEERWEEDVDHVKQLVQLATPGKRVRVITMPKHFIDSRVPSFKTFTEPYINTDCENVDVNSQTIPMPACVQKDIIEHVNKPHTPGLMEFISSAKKNNVTIDLSINITLPVKNFYELVTSSFEGVEDEFIDSVLAESIKDISKIKDVIRESLISYYNNDEE